MQINKVTLIYGYRCRSPAEQRDLLREARSEFTDAAGKEQKFTKDISAGISKYVRIDPLLQGVYIGSRYAICGCALSGQGHGKLVDAVTTPYGLYLFLGS